MNSTKINSFKSGLYTFLKFSHFTSEQLGSSRVVDVNDCIKLLLNDKLIMESKNHFTFTQRSQMVKIRLLECCLDILSDEDYHGVHSKIKKLNSLIIDSGINTENSNIND